MLGGVEYLETREALMEKAAAQMETIKLLEQVETLDRVFRGVDDDQVWA